MLAERARMAQPRISEIETPGERRLNIETLLRIAAAFDVGLQVRFCPIGELICLSESFDPENFEVQSFEDEIARSSCGELLNHPSESPIVLLRDYWEYGSAKNAQYPSGQFNTCSALNRTPFLGAQTLNQGIESWR